MGPRNINDATNLLSLRPVTGVTFVTIPLVEPLGMN